MRLAQGALAEQRGRAPAARGAPGPLRGGTPAWRPQPPPAPPPPPTPTADPVRVFPPPLGAARPQQAGRGEALRYAPLRSAPRFPPLPTAALPCGAPPPPLPRRCRPSRPEGRRAGPGTRQVAWTRGRRKARPGRGGRGCPRGGFCRGTPRGARGTRVMSWRQFSAGGVGGGRPGGTVAVSAACAGSPGALLPPAACSGREEHRCPPPAIETPLAKYRTVRFSARTKLRCVWRGSRDARLVSGASRLCLPSLRGVHFKRGGWGEERGAPRRGGGGQAV